MTIDEKIIDAKLRFGINKKAAKISALSSGKNDVNILQVKKYCPLIKDK